MPLIYCGIDEAGYGPTLGPLCVGMTVFRVENWNPGDPAPDLWSLLGRAVCRKTTDKRRRLAVDDSKKLKLANSSVKKHPCYHLERGVMTFLLGMAAEQSGQGTERPVEGGMNAESDLALLSALGVGFPAEPWYAGEPIGCPVGCTAGQLAIDANLLRMALADSGVCVRRLVCQALSETVFNELVEAGGSKAAATEAAWTAYLSQVWENFCGRDGAEHVKVVCDRQGGRTQYAGILARVFPESEVTIVAETDGLSKYEVACRENPQRSMSVMFKTEAETQHLPVALASMAAKLVRETMMARFNRYWCGRIPELKPTAGYALDAGRWLGDVREYITKDERRMLVRRA